MDDCVFCKIISGAIPSPRVYEDDQVLAIRDINPQAPVHILLMPKKHIASLMDVADSEPALVGRISMVAARLARKEGLGERGFRLLTNVGTEGGQAVPHLHFHLLGGRQMGWPPG
jgi:histidine triad (HIT) family protein